MSFYASYFVYDSVLSYDYGLTISSDSDDMSYSEGATVELITQDLFRRPKPYLLGVKQTPTLSIPVRFTVKNELSENEASAISRWLFGQMNYKKLQIIQPDMQYVYYNCIFTAPQVERVGNIIRGYTATIVCDSPFAWEYSQNVSGSYNASGYQANDTISINNTSDNADYTYPTVVFKMNLFGGGLTITNTSDSNRQFIFTGLDASETITVDNDLQIITSSGSGNRLPDFNYHWLRYVPKENIFTVSGNISEIHFVHQFARKIS